MYEVALLIRGNGIFMVVSRISLGPENGMSVEMGTHSVTPSAGVRVVRQLLAVYATLLKSSGLDGLELWNGSCQLVQTQTASEQIH